MYKLLDNLKLQPLDDHPFEGRVIVESDMPSNAMMAIHMRTEQTQFSALLLEMHPKTYMALFDLPQDFNETEVSIQVGIFNASEWVFGDILKVKVDLTKVRRTLKQKDQLKEMSLQILELKFRLDSYAKGFIKPNLPPFNKEYVQKGMVLMTIDDQGNVAFMKPFYDVVTEVNGVKADDKKLTLTAKDIPYNATLSMADIIKNVFQSLRINADNDKKIADTLEKIATSIGDIEKKLIEYTTNDIL